MTPQPTRGFLLRLTAAVVILLAAAAPPLLAEQGRVAATIVNNSDIAGKTGIGGATLSAEEEDLIRSYFDLNPDALGEVAPLSQGVRSKLQPGAILPLIRTRQALPASLDTSLPPRQGLDYQVIGSDVVLYDTASQRIVGVLKDVLRGG